MGAVGKLHRLLGGIAVTVACVWGGAAFAQDQQNVITLRSFDGFTQLKGELVDFDGSQFTIRTTLGVIQVDALKVNCEGEACPDNLLFGAQFGVFGSNTIGAALMPAIIEGYADSLDAGVVREIGQIANESTLRVQHEDGREMAAIELRSHGSGSSFDGLADGSAEIGMSSRRARRSDVAKLVQSGFVDPRDSEYEHVIAVDGLIIIVNQDNPLPSISLDEVARIFSGQITNWADIGGPDRAITVYARDDQSGTFGTFEDLVLSPAGLALAPSAKRFESNARLSDSVAADPSGIGFTALAYERVAKALPIRQECGLESAPTSFSVKTEEYPLSRRLYLYTRPGPMTAHAKQLVDFALSDDAQPLISDSGFVNQRVEGMALSEMGAQLIHALTEEPEISATLMRNMLVELRDAQRLSTTFRFTPGSSQLTPKSQADALKFARELAAGAYSNRQILLVGFTDSIGEFQLNEALSLRRAGVVDQIVRSSVAPGALDNVAIQVLGFGELMPVGCNSTFGGRFVNRRVEVWVRQRPGT